MSEFLNVCCLCTGTAYGPEYVEILYSAVRRNLAEGYRGRFIVFTDNPPLFAEMAGIETRLVPPDLKGWWGKLYLFSKDAFQPGERVLYFDLDTVITGPLDEIASYDGPFAILRDVYRPDGLQSSVMAWEAAHPFSAALWKQWEDAGRPALPGGDQEWIESVHPGWGWSPDILQDLFPRKFRSYKVDCQDFVPRGTSVVFFHGFPKPHQAGGWVKDFWTLKGPMSFAVNVKEDRMRANIAHALTKPNWIEMRDGTAMPAIIVGGGPSLANDLWRIRGYQLSGAVVYATNNTYRYLKENGITPDAHVMHDAREGNLPFVPNDPTICYYASQCHPSVLDAAGDRLVCWHPRSETCLDVIKDDKKGMVMVSGGSTIGLNAMSLAYILGHRSFMLFGFDSSYSEGAHHAYSQSLNDGESVIEVESHGKMFSCAPWMVQQSEQFVALANQLIGLGCHIQVHGTGLIPTIAANPQEVITAADLRAQSLLGWLKDIEAPVGAEIGVFAGELSQRLLKREDLRLYLVDSWTAQHAPEYAASGDFHAGLSQAKQDYYCRLAKEMVSFAGKRAQILRQDSREAAQSIPDGSLDFVFIDADHSYEGCRADILAWLPKVKPGGVVSGHDYENTDYPKFGVKRAVDELFQEVELGENFTWCVRR